METYAKYHRLVTEQGDYFLRQRLTCPPGIDDAREFDCQASAAAAGLAPTPRYFDSYLGIFVSDFIPNATPLSKIEITKILTTKPLITDIIRLISQLHRLPLCTAPLDIFDYLQILESKIINKKNKLNLNKLDLNNLYFLAEKMKHCEPDLVLCHWDCHPGNFLWQQDPNQLEQSRLWLVDFEYSQVADSSFDLASLAYYFKPTAAEFTEWQRNYLDQRPKSARADWAERLSLAQALLAGIHDLWYSAWDDVQSSTCR